MKGALRNSLWLLGVVALLLCCTPVFADSQFALTSTTGSLWGELTSPYGTNNSAVGSVICDDFKDDTIMNQNFTYKNESFSTLIGNINQGKGADGIWANNASLYEAGAYLALQIFNEPNKLNQQYENWAMWALFDPIDALAVMNANGVNKAGCNAIFGSGAWTGSTCTVGTGNGGLIANAELNGSGAYLSGAFNNLVVYIPQNSQLTGWCKQGGSCASQEFFGMVPEGGSAAVYLFLAGVSCLGAMVYSRRQTARAGLA
jgi:hypothetical protein